MKIDQKTKLAEIQTVFIGQFPHLRIEFYKRPHEPGEATGDREKLNVDLTLEEIAKAKWTKELQIDRSMTISEFEALMYEDFGLNVQVFRRSGNLWLQTTVTDNWSLDVANTKGGHSEELFEEQRQE